jgi:hypothetical protein
MQRAFVVRLGPETAPALGRFEGRVEEVDTGDELRFRSSEELLTFLAQRYDKASRGQVPKTGLARPSRIRPQEE